jgi:hypothetical protein
MVRSAGPPFVRTSTNWIAAEVRMADSITAVMKIGFNRGRVTWENC